MTARQVQKALAELSASLSARSLRPPLLSTRFTRSLAHGEQLDWQPVVDRRGRGLKSRVCLARPPPFLRARMVPRGQGLDSATSPSRAPRRWARKERLPCLTSEQATLATEEAR